MNNKNNSEIETNKNSVSKKLTFYENSKLKINMKYEYDIILNNLLK